MLFFLAEAEIVPPLSHYRGEVRALFFLYQFAKKKKIPQTTLHSRLGALPRGRASGRTGTALLRRPPATPGRTQTMMLRARRAGGARVRAHTGSGEGESRLGELSPARRCHGPLDWKATQASLCKTERLQVQREAASSARERGALGTCAGSGGRAPPRGGEGSRGAPRPGEGAGPRASLPRAGGEPLVRGGAGGLGPCAAPRSPRSPCSQAGTRGPGPNEIH